MGVCVYVCVAALVVVGVAVVVVVVGGCVDPFHAITRAPGSAVGHDICGRGEHMKQVTDWGHQFQSVIMLGDVKAWDKHKNLMCNKTALIL